MSKNKTKPKYDSSRKREDYTFHPARRFELIWDPEPGPCYLFALDERQAAMLRKMVQVFPKYHWVWGLESPRREWDATTWQLWNDIEAFVDELEACLVSGCDLNEWLKQQRMLVAAIVGEQVDLTDPAQLSPDAVDFTAASATPGLVPSLQYLQNLQTMGTIPGEGDTIQATLWDIRDGLTDGGKTLDDWITEMQIQEAIDPDNYDFKDWLEMLLLIKQLVPNFGASPLAWVMAQYKNLIATRHAHTHSTLMAYQATELRAIRNALAPFEEATDGEGNVTEDEESLVKGIISDLDKVPWLTTAIGALVDPSPTGETALAVKLAVAAKNLWDKLTTLYSNWMNTYINQVETLQPKLTVSGMIAELSKRIRGDDEDYGTTGQPATIFGAMQTLAWTQVSPQDEIASPGISTSNQLKAIADSLAALDADMPEGSTWPALFGQIAANIANIKLSCSCGGGGCGVCGGTEPPTTPGTEGDPPPDGWIDPPASGGGSTSPGEPEYQSRKCKISNQIRDGVYAAVEEFETVNVFSWITGKIDSASGVITEILLTIGFPFNLGLSALGWLSNLIVTFIGNIGVDLTDLKTKLDTYKQDLVCALYNATDATSAVNAFNQILTDNGATLAQTTVIEALIPTEALNALFFSPEETSDEFEAALAGYVGPVDCGVCEEIGTVFMFDFEDGLQNWVLSLAPPNDDYTGYIDRSKVGQSLAWVDNGGGVPPGDNRLRLLCGPVPSQAICKSPLFAYPCTVNTVLTVGRETINSEFAIWVEYSDSSYDLVVVDAPAYNFTEIDYPLSANGKTASRIYVAVGGQAYGPREVFLSYIGLAEV